MHNYAFKNLNKVKNIITYNGNKKINSNIIIFNKQNVFSQGNFKTYYS